MERENFPPTSQYIWFSFILSYLCFAGMCDATGDACPSASPRYCTFTTWESWIISLNWWTGFPPHSKFDVYWLRLIGRHIVSQVLTLVTWTCKFWILKLDQYEESALYPVVDKSDVYIWNLRCCTHELIVYGQWCNHWFLHLSYSYQLRSLTCVS